jgi:phosphate transport system permease protein
MTTTQKPSQPWRVIDKVSVTQQLVVHLGTPVIAMFITINTGISGYSGFILVWFLLHLATASLLGKFGKRKRSVSDSIFEVLASASVITFLLFFMSVLQPVVQIGFENFQVHHLFEDAKDTGVDTSLDIGGLGHALLGTLLTVGLATIISLPIGILAALYVTEVRGVLTPLVRFFVQAMSGVPSIIAGLFAYAVFIASGILTYSGFVAAIALSILMLPTVARTAEEVLKLVPDDLRSAALALGGTQWRSVRMVVLPAARSGLVTAAILGVARVIGETAPLLLTAFGNREYNLNPIEGPIATLPTYIFQQFLLGTENDGLRAWVAAFVLLALVGIVFAIARIVSTRFKQA